MFFNRIVFMIKTKIFLREFNNLTKIPIHYINVNYLIISVEKTCTKI